MTATAAPSGYASANANPISTAECFVTEPVTNPLIGGITTIGSWVLFLASVKRPVACGHPDQLHAVTLIAAAAYESDPEPFLTLAKKQVNDELLKRVLLRDPPPVHRCPTCDPKEPNLFMQQMLAFDWLRVE